MSAVKKGRRHLVALVRRVVNRAGVITPVRRHALRHTAATEMLRHGVPLEKIGLVLRHRGIDTTAFYAKADVALLQADRAALAGGRSDAERHRYLPQPPQSHRLRNVELPSTF